MYSPSLAQAAAPLPHLDHRSPGRLACAGVIWLRSDNSLFIGLTSPPQRQGQDGGWLDPCDPHPRRAFAVLSCSSRRSAWRSGPPAATRRPPPPPPETTSSRGSTSLASSRGRRRPKSTRFSPNGQ